MAELDYKLDEKLVAVHSLLVDRIANVRDDVETLEQRRAELPTAIADAKGDQREALTAELSQVDARRAVLDLEIGELQRRAHLALSAVYREAVDRLGGERARAVQELRDLRAQYQAADRDLRWVTVPKHRKRIFGAVDEETYRKQLLALELKAATLTAHIRDTQTDTSRAARRATRAQHALERVQTSGAWQEVA